MARVYNFSAGPSMLPESVLKKQRQKCLTTKAVVRALWKCHTAQKFTVQSSRVPRLFERGYEHS